MKAKTSRVEPALRALTREALLLTNSGKPGQLFGQIEFRHGLELIDNWWARLLKRVENGERVRLAGIGSFEMKTFAPKGFRSTPWRSLTFTAAAPHRGLPKVRR